MQVVSYFTDAVLQAPLIGCSVICLTCSIIGTFLVLSRKALLGEVLSHSLYPGVILALLCGHLLFAQDDITLFSELLQTMFVFVAAVCTAIVALKFLQFQRTKIAVCQDAAETATLASFFGLGLALFSLVQNDYPTLSRELQATLFGQVATMRQPHLISYLILSACVLTLVWLFFRRIEVVLFDPVFARLSGISQKGIEWLLLLLTIFSICIGIRAAGIVLVSAMLVFPAAAARRLSAKLKVVLLYAAVFGVSSGFFGLIIAHESSLDLPTGPIIVLLAASIFFLVVLFFGKEALLFRLIKKWRFTWDSGQENLLKMAWKECAKEKSPYLTRSFLRENCPRFLSIRLFFLQRKGLLQKKENDQFLLTPCGQLWGRKIVRLHRLWELYLVKCCKMMKDRVHPRAEEMEHILTPEIERELSFILDDPDTDPHQQPIPKELEILT